MFETTARRHTAMFVRQRGKQKEFPGEISRHYNTTEPRHIGYLRTLGLPGRQRDDNIKIKKKDGLKWAGII